MLTAQDKTRLRQLAESLSGHHSAIGKEWAQTCQKRGIAFKSTELTEARRAIVDDFFGHVPDGRIDSYIDSLHDFGTSLGVTREGCRTLGRAICTFEETLLSRLTKTRSGGKNMDSARSLHRLSWEIACRYVGESLTSRSHTGSGHDLRWQLLTERESEVAALLAQGLRNKTIAQKLRISVRTVEHHRARIREKLGIDSVAGLSALMEQSPLIHR
jgi:DNA-binding CsgD family transcriptional regulator